jgi:hypothetical protein
MATDGRESGGSGVFDIDRGVLYPLSMSTTPERLVLSPAKRSPHLAAIRAAVEKVYLRRMTAGTQPKRGPQGAQRAAKPSSPSRTASPEN